MKRWIALLVFLALLLTWGGYQFSIHLRTKDPRYLLRYIDQEAFAGVSLPTQYIEELLQLHREALPNYYTFCERQARKGLLSSPLIETGWVAAVDYDTIQVRYKTREPYFRLLDVTNRVVDPFGVVMSERPFFPELPLPTVLLGEASIADALHILQRAEEVVTLPSHLDLRYASHLSLGRREVVLKVANLLVRISPDRLEDSLRQIALLRDELTEEKQWVVDLRTPQAAFYRENL